MSTYKPDEYIQYRITRSQETLTEVKVHISNAFWNTAINRLYYACFYAVTALLAKDNVHISSHHGVRQKFGQLYIKNERISKELGRYFTDLSEKRNKGDYNDFFDFDEETVLQLYPKAEKFIKAIQEILNEQ